jgi:hypothetical protein
LWDSERGDEEVRTRESVVQTHVTFSSQSSIPINPFPIPIPIPFFFNYSCAIIQYSSQPQAMPNDIVKFPIFQKDVDVKKVEQMPGVMEGDEEREPYR